MGNRYIFHKKYFFRLFLIIFSISLMTISVCFYTAFYIYSANMSEEHKVHNTGSINSEMLNSESLLKEIDMLYTLICTNSTIRTFLNAAKADFAGEARVIEYLHNYQQLNACVDSIVLYNRATNRYLNGKPEGLDMSLFLNTYLTDLETYGTANNLSRHKNLFLYRGNISNEAEGRQKVLSVIYYDIRPNENIYNCIAVNLNSDKVANYLFKNISGISILTNEFGSVACSSTTLEDSTAAGYRSQWIRKLSGEQKTTGIFSDTIDNKKILVSYYKLTEYGWILFHTSEEISFHLFSSENLKYLLLIFLIDILFSALIAYFFSMKLYSPVNDIIGKLNKKYFGLLDSGSNNDEFGYVNDLFSTLSDRIVALEMENTNYLLSVKEDFLRRILDGTQLSDNAEAEWKLYSIEVEPRNLMVVLLKKDNLENSNRNEKVYSNLITGGINHLLRSSFHIETIITKTGDIALLLNFINDRESFEALAALLEKFQSFIAASTGISVSISIGGKADSIEECALCYRRALELIKHRFVLGYGKIIYQEYIDNTLSSGLTYPDELISELLINIRNANKESFLENYDKLLDILRRYVYHDVASILLQVITQCLHEMNSVSVDNSLLQVDFGEFDMIFNNLHTLDHTRSWFGNLFDEYLFAIQKLEQLKSDKYDQLVENMKKFIDNHYFDPDLSVESLAESAGYTANYFSKIFKKTTGMYLRDYIKMVRLSHAKELLKNTKLPIHEISEKTGFINQKYFFPIFKNEIGLTPAMYRSRWTTGTDNE